MHFENSSWFGHLAFVHSFKASNAVSGCSVILCRDILKGPTAPSLIRGVPLLAFKRGSGLGSVSRVVGRRKGVVGRDEKRRAGVEVGGLGCVRSYL